MNWRKRGVVEEESAKENKSRVDNLLNFRFYVVVIWRIERHTHVERRCRR